MKRLLHGALLLALAGFPGLAETASGDEVRVDVELVIAADVSDSMDAAVGRMQRQGYAAAFRSSVLWRVISQGLRGRIAVTYVEWGDSGLAEVVVPWTVVAGGPDAMRVAEALETRRISHFTKTAIGHALRFSQGLFDGNGLSGDRLVIDVSGNGPNNEGLAVDRARDAAVAAGITINGLPIMTDLASPRGPFANGFDRRGLARYYAHCVIGGVGAFVLPVRDLDAFTEALLKKLLLEVAGTAPELVLRAGFVDAGGMPC